MPETFTRAPTSNSAQRRRVGFREVPELAPGQMLGLALAECELHRVVAVALARAHRRHRTRAGLQDGHARDASVVLKDLRHAELLREDR
jgi:hypothetical protein